MLHLKSRRSPNPLIDAFALATRHHVPFRCFSLSSTKRATAHLDALDASKGDRERIVILGSGWAGDSSVSVWVQPLELTDQLKATP